MTPESVAGVLPVICRENNRFPERQLHLPLKCKQELFEVEKEIVHVHARRNTT